MAHLESRSSAMSSQFAEPRLRPLREDWREQLGAREVSIVRGGAEVWALNAFSPSRLRRHHSIGAFVPHFFTTLDKPAISGGAASEVEAPAQIWPDTDDEDFEDHPMSSQRSSLFGSPCSRRVDRDDMVDISKPCSLSLALACSEYGEQDATVERTAHQHEDLETSEEAHDTQPVADANFDDHITTVMIRNLPAATTQQDLIMELDQSGFKGLYDFVYMPSCFVEHTSKGYAFVNFTTSAVAGALLGAWHCSTRFCRSSDASPPLPLNVSPAHVQGLESNVKKWERMSRVRDVRLRPFVATPATRASTTLPSPMCSVRDRFTGSDAGLSRRSYTVSSDMSPSHGHHPSVSEIGCRSPAAPPQSLPPGRFAGMAASILAVGPRPYESSLSLPVAETPTAAPKAPPSALPSGAAEAAPEDCGELRPEATSLMVRNIPKGVTQEMVQEELDRSGFAQLYDFLYLPSSFDAREGKGYAFLNFVTPAAAQTFFGAWQRSRRFMSTDGLDKLLTITVAAVQGLEANSKKWSGPRMHRIRNPALRPVIRRGAQCTAQSTQPVSSLGLPSAAASSGEGSRPAQPYPGTASPSGVDRRHTSVQLELPVRARQPSTFGCSRAADYPSPVYSACSVPGGMSPFFGGGVLQSNAATSPSNSVASGPLELFSQLLQPTPGFAVAWACSPMNAAAMQHALPARFLSMSLVSSQPMMWPGVLDASPNGGPVPMQCGGGAGVPSCPQAWPANGCLAANRGQ